MAKEYIHLNSSKIELCFTKSNTVGSHLIRSTLEEPVSHVCLMVENAVIHSNFYGVHVDFKKRFLTKNTVVYRIPLEFKFKDLQERLEYLMQFYSKYDWSGFCYFAWRAVLRKLLNIPFPHKNLLNNRKAYLCTEFASMVIDRKDHGITTPYQLYLELKGERPQNGRILH